MKILKTNWINIVGVFSVIFLYTFLNSWINYPATFIQALFGAFLGICLYGMIFWVGFVILIIILDLILIVTNRKNLKLKLFLEWAVISTPFVYWSVIYKEQRCLYIVAIISFFITQLLRKKLLENEWRTH